VGDADLARKLGTLRYLKGLQAARRSALAAATPDAPQPPPFVYSKGQPGVVSATAWFAGPQADRHLLPWLICQGLMRPRRQLYIGAVCAL
jgi:hypothetical protein